MCLRERSSWNGSNFDDSTRFSISGRAWWLHMFFFFLCLLCVVVGPVLVSWEFSLVPHQYFFKIIVVLDWIKHGSISCQTILDLLGHGANQLMAARIHSTGFENLLWPWKPQISYKHPPSQGQIFFNSQTALVLQERTLPVWYSTHSTLLQKLLYLLRIHSALLLLLPLFILFHRVSRNIPQ